MQPRDTARTRIQILWSGVLSLVLISASWACAGEVETPQSMPWSDAGDDQRRAFLTNPVVIGLDGRASCDPLGEPLSTYTWSVQSQPNGAAVELQRADSVHPSFVANLPGVYVLALIVEAGQRSSEPDLVRISVETELEEEVPLRAPSINRCGETL